MILFIVMSKKYLGLKIIAVNFLFFNSSFDGHRNINIKCLAVTRFRHIH